MNFTHDLVILGAGPAGSMAALVAARAGFSVAVLDKSTFPRPKICGDCLNPRIWKIWQRWDLTASFSRLPHHRLTRLRLSRNFEDPLEFPISEIHGEERAVSRGVFDQWLKTEAESSGAGYFTETYPLALESDHTLPTNRGVFRGRVLLGADGRNSWLARAAGLHRPGRRCRRIAWQTSLPGSVAGDAVHMTFFPEGYFGLARHDDSESNLCMVLKEGSETTAQEIATRYFPALAAGPWRSTNPITRAPARAAEHNILLAGDAARVVEPFTGEGIYLAVASGELAGTAVTRALEGGTLDLLARHYRAQHRRLYHHLTWQNPLTRWLGSHPAMGCGAVQVLRRSPRLARRLCAPFL